MKAIYLPYPIAVFLFALLLVIACRRTVAPYNPCRGIAVERAGYSNGKIHIQQSTSASRAKD